MRADLLSVVVGAKLDVREPRLAGDDVLAELVGDVGVVAVAQAVEDVVADVDVVWAVVAVEDPGPFECCLGVAVVVAIAEGGVLRAVPVGQRSEQDDRFVVGEDVDPSGAGLDRSVRPGCPAGA